MASLRQSSRFYVWIFLISILLFIYGIIIASISFKNGPLFVPDVFAVDSKERVYLPAHGRIRVFDGQQEVGTIRVTERGYTFTIIENDVLVYSNGTDRYYIDLSNEIPNDYRVGEIDFTPEQEVVLKHRRTDFIADNGTQYRLNIDFRGYRITCENRTVFVMPMVDYICTVSFIVILIDIFVLVLRIYNQRKPANKS